jgi:uncharacterized protein YlbG (UPF0298 family)
LTISSTASPVVLAKKFKKIVVKMDRKADKRDKKIMGMLKYIKQELKYVQILVKEHAVDGYTEKKPSETVYSSCLCSFRTMVIGLYLPRKNHCTTG